MLVFLLHILLALIRIFFILTKTCIGPLHVSLLWFYVRHLTHHASHCGKLASAGVPSFFDWHLLFVSYDIAKVREALHQDVLARTKIISDVQFMSTIVISIVLIEYASHTLYDEVDTISILWQIFSLLNVFIDFSEYLTEAIVLIL